MKGFRKNWKKLIVLAITFALSFAIILIASVPERYDYVEGDVCVEDILTPREIEDRYTTENRRKAAAETVEEQYYLDYKINESKSEDLLAALTVFYENLGKAEDTGFDAVGRLDKIEFDIEKELNIDFLKNDIEYILKMEEREYKAFNNNVHEVFNEVMNLGVTNEKEAVDEMSRLFRLRETKEAVNRVAEGLFKKYVAVNKSYDSELTKAEQREARNRVAPVVYKKNQIIARKGEIITAAQITILEDLGLIEGSNHVNIQYAMGIFGFMGVFYGVAIYYIRLKTGKKILSDSKIILSMIIPLIILLIVFLMRNVGSYFAYLAPIPCGVILINVFAGSRISTIVNIYLSFATAIMLSLPEEFIIAMIMYSSIASVIFKRVEGVSGYAKAMAYTMATGAVCMAIAFLVTGNLWKEILKFALLGLANGLISSVLTIGTTPIFENIFNILTPFKLGDLGNPEKPLLKRLMFEAPGTYHHCLMVGNLAEAACIRIGADNQLARVAAYYHDIGKLRRPGFFFENQLGENPHDQLMPIESAKVLQGHVWDGLEIAKQYRLPKDIQNIIRQHHGKTLTGFFYKKELEINPEANEEDFRYPGPKPESKEAGIVMLADSCEAAVRSLDEKTEETIRAMVTKIVKSRMSDGELDECDLSFRELGEIVDAFVAMLGSHFHKRIKYDREPKTDESDNR